MRYSHGPTSPNQHKIFCFHTKYRAVVGFLSWMACRRLLCRAICTLLNSREFRAYFPNLRLNQFSALCRRMLRPADVLCQQALRHT